ncbi:hypothetical protein BDV18DRAFT_142396 [Aspergillus unguis]
MRKQSQLQLGLVLVFASALLAFAKEDVNYDPTENYRPQNVTGLDYWYYPWVGSYYNGSAVFTIADLQIRSRDSDDGEIELCPQLQNYTYTFSYPALLGVTETENEDDRPENTNAVNVILSTSYSNFTKYFSNPIDSGNLQMEDEPWVFESIALSHPKYRYETTPPNFNLTLAPESSRGNGNGNGDGTTYPFRMLGTSSDPVVELPGMHSNMSSCRQIEAWWGVSFAYADDDNDDAEEIGVLDPALQLSFDRKSASFQLLGSIYMDPFGEYAEDGVTPAVVGRIRVEFLGDADVQRSDLLGVNGNDEPVWTRTVGFGNYSENLDGDDEGGASALRGWNGLSWVVALVVGYFML